jgi:hypothetical protein
MLGNQLENGKTARSNTVALELGCAIRLGKVYLMTVQKREVSNFDRLVIITELWY